MAARDSAAVREDIRRHKRAVEARTPDGVEFEYGDRLRELQRELVEAVRREASGAEAAAERTAAGAVKALRERIDTLVMANRVLLSDLGNPERVRREVARLRERAAKDLAEADRTEARLATAREQWTDNRDEIEALHRECVALANSARLDRVTATVEGLAAAGVDVQALLLGVAATAGGEEAA
jgi:hypothetical protein